MATASAPPVYNDSKAAVFRRLDPTKYTSLADFIDEINKPDNRDQLVKTYGYQQISGGLTGFLNLTGAVRASGTADEVQYWEETRLHQFATVAPTASAAAAATAFVAQKATSDASVLRLNDVVLVGGQDRFIVTAISPTGEVTQTATADYTLQSLSSAGLTASVSTASVNLPVIGNLFAQGSDQNSGYLESNVIKRTNAYSIIKEVFKVTGSQATNIGWVNVGNGDYRWYVKGEMDTRARFLDKREMMLLLGQNITNTLTTTNIGGLPTSGEGYFSAIENRGIVQSGQIDDFTEFDILVTELDKQGAAPEYAMYVNTAQALAIDNMVASLNGAAGFADATVGVNAFGGKAGDAAKLGFQSFVRGGYTFHKHSWKLLNDPTLLGVASPKYLGAMIPMTTVVDPKTGNRAAALELNYKDTNGYSREMEHWMTGSILGVNNTNVDSLQFNYRSECALITRAANQHILIKA
jgi:hypothetical protein